MSTDDAVRVSNQLVGNIGLFYICYELSKRGWNALPTSRNARGIDIIIYSQDAKRKFTIQCKSLRRKSPVPLGRSLDSLYANYLIICRNVYDKPETFITKISDTVKQSIHKGERDGIFSYWFQPKDYEKFRENWNVIGTGF